MAHIARLAALGWAAQIVGAAKDVGVPVTARREWFSCRDKSVKFVIWAVWTVDRAHVVRGAPEELRAVRLAQCRYSGEREWVS